MLRMAGSKVVMCDYQTGEHLAELGTHEGGAPRHAEYSPDGRFSIGRILIPSWQSITQRHWIQSRPFPISSRRGRSASVPMRRVSLSARHSAARSNWLPCGTSRQLADYGTGLLPGMDRSTSPLTGRGFWLTARDPCRSVPFSGMRKPARYFALCLPQGATETTGRCWESTGFRSIWEQPRGRDSGQGMILLSDRDDHRGCWFALRANQHAIRLGYGRACQGRATKVRSGLPDSPP